MDKYRRRLEAEKNWQQDYKRKLCSAYEAASLIKDHDVICLTGGSNIPPAFSHELSHRAQHLKDVTILLGFALDEYDFMKPEFKDNLCIETAFVGRMERKCLQWGTASYVPLHLQQLGKWLDFKKPNVVATVVTPPDEDGYMNRSCYAGLCHRRAFERADLVIVEVNPETPWLNGDDFKIHVSEVDRIIENPSPLAEIPDIPITRTEEDIAGYIADLIPDGSTIQLGLGSLANAVGYLLRNKKDLGLHAEVISNSVMELVKSGAVNGSRKTFMPGKVVGTYCVGTKELFEFVDHNEDFVFCEVEFTNDPEIIARNDNLISINNTLMVDLTGQAASESIGSFQYSGTGGQVNFVQGAHMARGGKSILALNATYTDEKGGLHSRIVASFPPGTVVTTSRADVEYVVTEFGVASLRFKSVAKRVVELINIAHPDFRDELRFEARKAGWI